MKPLPISFKAANQQLIWVLLIGVALGVANYALGAWPNLGHSMIQQCIISLVIGYSILLISFNAPQWFTKLKHPNWAYVILVILFAFVGVLGSEVQLLVEGLVFQGGSYQFLAGGGIYLFNAILTILLGFLTYRWAAPTLPSEELPTEDLSPEPPLDKIPIRRGEAILLHSVDEISFFEAYDNYSFLHDLAGDKHLCNYSLAFLEKRLDANFLRVHRKYLINQRHIHQIKPHLKGRFVIEFNDQKRSAITTGSTYNDAIKGIIKL